MAFWGSTWMSTIPRPIFSLEWDRHLSVSPTPRKTAALNLSQQLPRTRKRRSCRAWTTFSTRLPKKPRLLIFRKPREPTLSSRVSACSPNFLSRRHRTIKSRTPRIRWPTIIAQNFNHFMKTDPFADLPESDAKRAAYAVRNQMSNWIDHEVAKLKKDMTDKAGEAIQNMTRDVTREFEQVLSSADAKLADVQ